MDVATYIGMAGVVLFTALALTTDLRTRKIPNWLNVASLALALLFHGLTGGWVGLGVALGGFAVGFGLLLVLWILGGSGGGDVKLMGALGAWLGPFSILIVFVLSGLFVALGSVAMLCWNALADKNFSARRAVLAGKGALSGSESPFSSELLEARKREPKALMPYALPVALGAWLLLAWRLLQAAA